MKTKKIFKSFGEINSAIIYEGPSEIDGSPIVVITTAQSRNGKTGGMDQTWILRADIDPITANRTGEDFAICGDCVLRGTPSAKQTGYAIGRGCYVNLIYAPNGVFKTYINGGYPTVSPDQLTKYGKGRKIRVGAYGDPMAVPGWVWDKYLAASADHTGYTHQLPKASKKLRGSFAKFCMASADTLEQAQDFWAEGFRTFRTIASPSDLVFGEILCPATEEAGKKTNCEKCGLCKGSSIQAKNIAAVVHGPQKKNAARLIAA